MSVQRHRFGPRERGGIVFGLRAGQLVILAVALVLMTTTVRSTASLPGALAGLVILVGGAVVAFLPVRRRQLDQWLSIVAHHLGRRWYGQTRWLSRAHLQGHLLRLGEAIQDALPPRDAPPGLRGVEVLAVHAEGLGSDVGVLRDGRRYVGVVSAQGQGFALMDPEDQARLGNAWASLIGSYAVADSLVKRIGFIERATPEDPGGLRSYALEKIPELAGARTEAGVDAALQRVPEPRQSHLRSYLEGVALSGPTAQQHECLVALLVDASAPRVARQLKRIGRGEVGRGACEVLIRQLADLSERLETNLDVKVHGVLTPRLLAEAVRSHYYPAARRRRRRLEQVGAEVGEHPTNAGPRAFAEHLDHVQADGACHVTYHLAEFPRQDVSVAFLAPLVLHTKAARTLAMVMEPVEPQRAGREIDASHYVRNLIRRGREHYGFEPTFRQRSEDEKVEQVGEEHAAGHVNVRFSAYVTVSAESREELEWATAEVETQMAQSLLEGERLWGQQGPAFTYTLPLLRGLAS